MNRCGNCQRELLPGEPAYLAKHRTLAVCRPCKSAMMRIDGYGQQGGYEPAATRSEFNETRRVLRRELGRLPNGAEVRFRIALARHWNMAVSFERWQMWHMTADAICTAGGDPTLALRYRTTEELLLIHEKALYNHVMVSSHRGACDPCRATAGMAWELSVAIQLPLLPHAGCKCGTGECVVLEEVRVFGFCACRYHGIGEEDFRTMTGLPPRPRRGTTPPA